MSGIACVIAVACVVIRCVQHPSWVSGFHMLAVLTLDVLGVCAPLFFLSTYWNIFDQFVFGV